MVVMVGIGIGIYSIKLLSVVYSHRQQQQKQETEKGDQQQKNINKPMKPNIYREKYIKIFFSHLIMVTIFIIIKLGTSLIISYK